MFWFRWKCKTSLFSVSDSCRRISFVFFLEQINDNYVASSLIALPFMIFIFFNKLFIYKYVTLRRAHRTYDVSVCKWDNIPRGVFLTFCCVFLVRSVPKYSKWKKGNDIVSLSLMPLTCISSRRALFEIRLTIRASNSLNIYQWNWNWNECKM